MNTTKFILPIIHVECDASYNRGFDINIVNGIKSTLKIKIIPIQKFNI